MESTPTTPATPRRQRLRHGLRRAGRLVRWVLLGVAGLLLVLVLVLALPAGREFLLRTGLDLVAGNLADRDPASELKVGNIGWPQAGNLSLSDVVWTTGPDTLARIETLRLQIDLSDLWHRDLMVRLAAVKGLSVDLPAVRAYLPAGATDDTVAETEPIAVPFLRSGAWPTFPSVAIERLTLARVALTTAPDLTAHLDSLDLSLELRHGHRPHIAASLRARPLSTLGVSWRLQGTIDADTLDLALAPLHLAAPARLPAVRDLPLDGRLRLPLAVVDSLLVGSVVWPSLTIDQLMIEGDAGTWRLDASLLGRTRGQIVLNSELPEAPVALLAGLATLARDTTVTRARLDLLASRWSEHGRPGVDLTLDITPPPPSAALDQARVQARGRLRLPAPAAIASLLPPQLMIADLGPIDLDLAASYDGTASPAAMAVDLDLGRTAWLDQAQIQLSGDLESIHQAGFDLRLPGLAITASGRADQDSLQLDLALEVPDAALLERWRDPTLADLELQTSLQVQASGPWSRPRAGLQMSATAASPQFTLPRAEITASVEGDSIRLHAGLPSGLQVLAHEVSQLDLDFHGSVTDSLRHLHGHLDLAAQAPPLALALRGQLDLRDPATDLNLNFDGDHLALKLDRRTLTSSRPWQLAFSAADTTVQVEGLQLAGSLGHLDLQGRATPTQIDAVLDLELRLLLDALRPLLPEANQAQLPAGTLNIVGQGRATGPPSAIWANGSLQVEIVDQPASDDLSNLTGLAAQLHASLGGQGPAPTTLDPGPLGWQAGRARLQGSLLDHETTLASVTARIPWPLAGTASDSLNLRLNAPALDLGRLAQFLPPDHEVSGQLSIDAHIRGRVPAGLADLDSLQNLEGLDHLELVRDLDLVLAGNLHLQDLAVQLADGTRMILAGDLDLQGTSRSPLVTADLVFSGDLGNVDVQASVRPDSLSANLELALELDSEALRPYLPLDQQALLPRGNLALGGMIDAAGLIESPWAVGNLQMQVIDQPEVAALTSNIDLLVGGRGDVPAHLAGTDRRWRAESLRLRLRLLDAGEELLRLSALAPLPHLTAGPDSLDLRLDARALDLSRLAPLLPAGISLSGRFDAATRVSGLMLPGQTDPDLDLSGKLSVADLRLQLPDGSRVALRGQVELAGTSQAPQIRGGLHIVGGLLRLPDPPPTLLPASGGALLWEAKSGETTTASQLQADPDMTTASAGADTAGGQAADESAPPEPPADTAAGSPAVRAILPELVFTVTSPGGLWLRGQGLDVELAGDLSLLLRSGQLAIEGQLQAIQGTMSQLGHTFRLEQGRITFDGSETELNPELDLVLSVLVGEYRIRILLGGSAQEPSLRFSSEPELSEGDILATLLFGKPLAELDEGQTGLLASRAAQIAAAYGSARLSESLARQLGVDVVSIAPREGDEETTALTIGKYLSPRVMVRYEQLLREGSAFFVHLDYRFAGAFRLHTQVSQGEESGLELKWQQDW